MALALFLHSKKGSIAILKIEKSLRFFVGPPSLYLQEVLLSQEFTAPQYFRKRGRGALYLRNICPAKSRSFVLSTPEQDPSDCSRRKSQTTLWIECVGCNSSFLFTFLWIITRDRSRFDNSTTGQVPISRRE